MGDNETLIHLFERIQFFLQRLTTYIKMPLTNDLTELLGKIMAQILHIPALSTKAMTESRTSKLSLNLCTSLAEYGSETFSKKLLGRTDVDDALLRLDKLTKEESIDQAVKALKERTHWFLTAFVHIPILSPIVSQNRSR